MIAQETGWWGEERLLIYIKDWCRIVFLMLSYSWEGAEHLVKMRFWCRRAGAGRESLHFSSTPRSRQCFSDSTVKVQKDNPQKCRLGRCLWWDTGRSDGGFQGGERFRSTCESGQCINLLREAAVTGQRQWRSRWSIRWGDHIILMGQPWKSGVQICEPVKDLSHWKIIIKMLLIFLWSCGKLADEASTEKTERPRWRSELHPPDSCVEALTPRCDKALQKATEVKWRPESGTLTTRGETPGSTCIQERPGEDTVRGCHLHSRKRGHIPLPTPPARPASRTLRTKFPCLSHPVCGILLWRPVLTHAPAFLTLKRAHLMNSRAQPTSAC